MTDTIDTRETTFDLIITNGLVIDGTGAPRRVADIAIDGDRIVAVAERGQLRGNGAAEIDAAGRVVTPGFIDVHTHDDNAVLVMPEMTPKISQGVTTVIAGNCGISLAPLVNIEPPPPLNLLGDAGAFRFERVSDYVSAVDAARPAVNLALLIGHGTLRVGAMSDFSGKATTAEIDIMRTRLADGLKAGAIGFSTGLYYKPNAGADMNEVVALAELLSHYGGIYATHMRDEQDEVLDSLRESFETARRATAPVVISHHKCVGRRNWGRSAETLPFIEAARDKQPIGLDAYPYAAGSTVLEADRLDDDTRIMVTWSRPHPELSGQDLADIAVRWRCSTREAARRLHPAGGIFFRMDEQDVRRILAYPHTMIGSDGLPHDRHPHPRLWGTFPRVLGHYCRDEGLFTLEQAVHKMTGLSAATFGLEDRGVVRAGAYADLVVLDPVSIADQATFEMPERPSLGIEHVLVGGRVSWTDGASTGERAGRFIARTGGYARSSAH